MAATEMDPLHPPPDYLASLRVVIGGGSGCGRTAWAVAESAIRLKSSWQYRCCLPVAQGGAAPAAGALQRRGGGRGCAVPLLGLPGRPGLGRRLAGRGHGADGLPARRRRVGGGRRRQRLPSRRAAAGVCSCRACGAAGLERGFRARIRCLNLNPSVGMPPSERQRSCAAVCGPCPRFVRMHVLHAGMMGPVTKLGAAA